MVWDKKEGNNEWLNKVDVQWAGEGGGDKYL